MADNQNQPKIGMRVQEDKSILFDAKDGITIRAAYDSPTQLRVEMWRDSDKVIIPPDVGNIGTKTFRDRLAKNAREKFNPPPGKDEKKPKDTVPHLDEDLGHVATALGIPAVADLLKEESAPTLVDRLIECVDEVGELFTTSEGEPHAALTIDEHTETHEIRGTNFRRWLRGHFYSTERQRLEAQAAAAYEQIIAQLGAMAAEQTISVRKPPVVREQTLADAIAQLWAKADYEKKVEEVHVRVGHHDGKQYIDLGNETWDAIEIDAEGWRIVQNPPVRFVRPKGLQPLPYPVEGGSLNDLRGILTLGDGEDANHAWALIATFLAVSLRSDAAEYPILILLGAQGSAKSTTSRMIRALVDPNVVEDTGEPRSKEELHIDADCSWLMAYDNLDTLSKWLSNAIARISTGSAFTKRTQYTNRDREIFKAAQPQILNGIADIVTRADVLDRGLNVTLPVIEEYREGNEVWAGFCAVRPKILGALYSAVAAGLKSVADGVEIDAKLPRMADYAKWSIRVEAALGLEPGSFMEAFAGSRDEGAATVLESEPISYRVFEYARNFTAADPWEGTSKQLLDILNERETDEGVMRGAAWPKGANVLSGLLGRIAPALKGHGVIWRRANLSNKKRLYVLYYEAPAADEGDDTSGVGDDPFETTVPQGNSIDKPNAGGGTIGDDGSDTFPIPEDGDDEATF
jgi:hypothetical protein